MAQKQLATKTGGLAISLPVFAGFETSLAKRFRAEFTTFLCLNFCIFYDLLPGNAGLSLKKIGICTLDGLTQTG